MTPQVFYKAFTDMGMNEQTAELMMSNPEDIERFVILAKIELRTRQLASLEASTKIFAALKLEHAKKLSSAAHA
jgi:hypothetical protein